MFNERPTIASELYAALLPRIGAAAFGWRDPHSTPHPEELTLRTELLLRRGDRRARAALDNGNTPLHEAAKRPEDLPAETHALVVQALIALGCDVDARNMCGRTALHSACFGGQSSFARALLLSGADPNALSPDGDRPLHEAALHGGLDLLSLLLERGADPTALGAKKLPAWRLAERSPHEGASSLLLQAAERKALSSASLQASQPPVRAPRPRL